MNSSRTLLVCTAVFFTVGSSRSAVAQGGLCKDIAASMIKHILMPYHAYRTATAGYNGGKTTHDEMISTGRALYISIDGKWQRSPATPQDMQEMQRAAADSVSKVYKCSRVGSEVVNGVTAQRYHVEKINSDEAKEDVWIGGGGRLERLDIDMDVGAGATGKSHSTTRYEYTNVQAPSGVN